MTTTINEPKTQNIPELIESTFGNLPVQDIYSYKNIYLGSKNGMATDLRLKMIRLYETGDYTQSEIAKLFNSSRKSSNKWINRYDT